MNYSRLWLNQCLNNGGSRLSDILFNLKKTKFIICILKWHYMSSWIVKLQFPILLDLFLLNFLMGELFLRILPHLVLVIFVSTLSCFPIEIEIPFIKLQGCQILLIKVLKHNFSYQTVVSPVVTLLRSKVTSEQVQECGFSHSVWPNNGYSRA